MEKQWSVRPNKLYNLTKYYVCISFNLQFYQVILVVSINHIMHFFKNSSVMQGSILKTMNLKSQERGKNFILFQAYLLLTKVFSNIEPFNIFLIEEILIIRVLQSMWVCGWRGVKYITFCCACSFRLLPCLLYAFACIFVFHLCILLLSFSLRLCLIYYIGSLLKSKCYLKSKILISLKEFNFLY